MRPTSSFQRLHTWINANYHWVVAFLALSVMFFHGGISNNLAGLHLVPFAEHLEANRSAISLALTGKNISSFFFVFFSGFFIKKYGSRVTMSTGLAIATLAYIILGSTNGFSALIIGGILVGSTNAFCSTAAAAQFVRAWFHRHAGTVLGVITSASGIGGSVMCLVQTKMMETFSWRASLYTAAFFLGIIFVLCALFLRSNPQDKSLVPLGEGEEIIGKKRRISQNVFPGLPMQKLARKPVFYTMLLATFLISVALYLVFTVVRPFLIDCGYSSNQASGLTSAMMLFLTAAKLITGFLCDRFGAKTVSFGCSLLGATGIGILAVSNSFSIAAVAIVIYSFSLPLLSIIPPLLAFSIFGYKAQSQYTGIFIAIISGANFLAEILTNFIYDRAGTYRVSFLLAVGITLVAIVFQRISFHLAEKELKKTESES